MVQLVGALFGFWLIKLLSPSDYGKMAALVIFSNLASCLQESGFTAALANKHEPRHEDYNAVFWFNIIVGVTLYVILFATAPLIARFYAEPVLVPLSRVAFLSFVVSSFGTAQRAYLFGHMRVRQNSISLLVATTVSGAAGVAMAYAGMAYWGLALQSVVYVSMVTLMSWHFSPWRPTLHIDLRPAWRMFGFSSKLLINSFASQLNSNAFGVLLNRFFPDKGHTAGLYSNARKWNDMAIVTICGMVQGVAQPMLVESSTTNSDSPPPAEGNNPLSIIHYPLIKAFRKLLRFTCFVSFPAMLGLALIARDFVVVLLGEKWSASVPLLQMLCIYGAFAPVVTLYSNLVISRGRSTINMSIGLINCVLVWGGLITLHIMAARMELSRAVELYAMVVYYVILNVAWLIVWQAAAKRLIGLRWWHALIDILPFWFFALAVILAAWWLTHTWPLSVTRMLVRIVAAATLYIGALWVARARILRESIQFIMHKKEC